MQCKFIYLTLHVEILNLNARKISKCTFRNTIHTHCHYTAVIVSIYKLKLWLFSYTDVTRVIFFFNCEFHVSFLLKIILTVR